MPKLQRSVCGVAIIAVLVTPVSIHAQTRPAPAETGGVFGFLLDPLDGGVADVRVFLTRNEPYAQHIGTTNKAGYFEFEKLPVGTYRVTAEVGFVPATTVTVAANERVEHRVRMKLEGRFEVQFGICAECVVTTGPASALPESIQKEIERDEEVIRNQPVVGPRVPGSDRLFTIPYPETLREKKIEGTAVLEGQIGTDGFPTSMRVVSSDHPELGPAAIGVLQDLQWEPARVRGVAVEYPLSVTIKFSLRPDSP